MLEDEGYTSPAEDQNNLEGNRIFVGYDQGIPWEEIATLPLARNPNLHWECLKAPFPYRRVDFLPNPTADRIALHFCSDDVRTASEIVDQLWKVSPNYLRSNFGIEVGAGDGHEIGLPLEPSVPNPSPYAEELRFAGLKPIYISLKNFIQHSVHLLTGRESPSFSYSTDNKPGALFKKNINILVHGISPKALLNYSEPLIRCGSLFKTLSEAVIGGGIRDLQEPSSVFSAYLKFVGNYIKLHQTILMLKGPSITTLTRLKNFINPFMHQLEALNLILNSLLLKGNAGDLLAELNDLIFTEEAPFMADLIRNLLLSCSSSYLKLVSDWIFRGELSPTSEFLVKKGRTSFEDRRFWTKQFTEGGRIPFFLENFASKIYETGQAINLLNAIQPLFPELSLELLLHHDIDEALEPVLSFEGLTSLRASWELKRSHFEKENVHLINAIRSAIEEVIFMSSASKTDPNDSITPAEARIELQNKARTAADRKEEQQLELRTALNTQIQLAKELKAKLKVDEEAEDKKIQQYIQRKENEEFKEKKRIAQKYNYDYNFDRPEASEPVQSDDDPSAGSSTLLGLLPIENGGWDDFTRHEDQIDQFTHSSQIHDDSVQLEHTNCGEISVSTPELESIKEERFNPDKLRVRDPPPYDLSFPSIRTSLIPVPSPQKSNDHTKADLTLDAHCVNHLISESIAIPLNAQRKMVNTALLYYIIVEKKLYNHLSAINSFLCLQNGLFCRFLNDLLIEEVNHGAFRNPDDIKHWTGRLNNILTEALTIAMENEESNPFVKHLTFSLARDHKTILANLEASANMKARSKFQLLNLLRLSYTVEWPLNIILTDEMMLHYEKIFGFLMQVGRAERLLERVFYLLNCKNSKSAQLHWLHNIRYRFFHFVRSIRNYVNVTVIHTAWSELCSNYHKLDNLEKIYEYLVSHVKNISKSCLLGKKGEGLMKLLSSKLRVIESFCSSVETICMKHNIDWRAGNEIPKNEFQELCYKFSAAEELGKIFAKCAFKLTTKGVYPKVAVFFQLYNFNEFFQPVIDSQ